MENKDWREEIEKDFDELFFEGERNSVYCKKHKVLATPYEVKSFARFQVEKILKSKQEEIEGEMEKMIKKNTYRHTAGCRGFQNQIYLAGDSLVADCTCNPLLEVNYTEYNEVLDDLKPIISNILLK